MIPTPPKPIHAPGTRLRVTQHVRVGHREWTTQVEGLVEKESLRPVGGMEMGGKASTVFSRPCGSAVTTARSPWSP